MEEAAAAIDAGAGHPTMLQQRQNSESGNYNETREVAKGRHGRGAAEGTERTKFHSRSRDKGRRNNSASGGSSSSRNNNSRLHQNVLVRQRQRRQQRRCLRTQQKQQCIFMDTDQMVHLGYNRRVVTVVGRGGCNKIKRRRCSGAASSRVREDGRDTDSISPYWDQKCPCGLPR